MGDYRHRSNHGDGRSQPGATARSDDDDDEDGDDVADDGATERDASTFSGPDLNGASSREQAWSKRKRRAMFLLVLVFDHRPAAGQQYSRAVTLPVMLSRVIWLRQIICGGHDRATPEKGNSSTSTGTYSDEHSSRDICLVTDCQKSLARLLG